MGITVPEPIIIIIFIIGLLNCIYYVFLGCKYIVKISTNTNNNESDVINQS